MKEFNEKHKDKPFIMIACDLILKLYERFIIKVWILKSLNIFLCFRIQN